MSAWDTLAMHSGVAKREQPVQFQDVHLYAQPALLDRRPLRLSVALHRGNGKFEVYKILTRQSKPIDMYKRCIKRRPRTHWTLKICP